MQNNITVVTVISAEMLATEFTPVVVDDRIAIRI